MLELVIPNNGSQEKCLEVGKRTSEDIDSHLSEGHTLLKIQRFGLGTDTRYHILAARDQINPIFFGLVDYITLVYIK